MLQPPPLRRAPAFPATAGCVMLALAATLPTFVGADVDPLLMDIRAWRGEPWRIVSCIFPHGDVIHLVFNLYWTWSLGAVIEERLGSVKSGALFLVFAAGASTLDWLFSSGGIGLSGVVYGMWAMLAILSTRSGRFGGTMDADTNRLMIFWFFLCIVLTQMGMMRVANVAHGAGAVLGGLAGFAIAGVPAWRRVAAGAGIAALVVPPVVAGPLMRPYVNVTRDRGEDSMRAGTRALEENRDAEGLELLTDAVRLRPSDAGVWWNLGIALTRTGNEREALAAFARAEQLDPTIAKRNTRAPDSAQP